MTRASESVQSLGGLALVMVVIHTFFWITLVLMMGTLFESSGGVMVVPMALYFVLWMGSGMIPGLVYISPLPPRVLAVAGQGWCRARD